MTPGDATLGHVLTRLGELGDGQARISVELGVLTASVDGLSKHVARQNGRIGQLESDMRLEQIRAAHEDGEEFGRQKLRARNRARLATIWRVAQSDYVRLGMMAGGIGLIARYWPW